MYTVDSIYFQKESVVCFYKLNSCFIDKMSTLSAVWHADGNGMTSDALDNLELLQLVGSLRSSLLAKSVRESLYNDANVRFGIVHWEQIAKIMMRMESRFSIYIAWCKVVSNLQLVSFLHFRKLRRSVSRRELNWLWSSLPSFYTPLNHYIPTFLSLLNCKKKYTNVNSVEGSMCLLHTLFQISRPTHPLQIKGVIYSKRTFLWRVSQILSLKLKIHLKLCFIFQSDFLYVAFFKQLLFRNQHVLWEFVRKLVYNSL